MPKFLITGGAGYIGGVCVEELINKDCEVVILDNLSVGHRENIHPKAAFYEGSIGDKKLLDKIFHEHEIDTVIHFAGLIQVGESVKDPAKYFNNNLHQGITLLDSMIKNDVKKIIFSSTAAVYGMPETMPITEEDIKEPINPYGESKYFFEQIIKRYSYAYGLKYTIFRYFNACGATDQSLENHEPESHLIPLVFHAAIGKRPNVTVLGTDYDTPDGTCVRDYIHVLDLVDAHIKAVRHMETNFANEFNLGTGKGYSVKEVIDMVKAVTAKDIEVVFGDRREGDAKELVADPRKAMKELDWKPKHSDLKEIIESVWKAIQNPPIKKRS